MTKIFKSVILIAKRIGGFFKRMFDGFVKNFFILHPIIACPLFTMKATIDALMTEMTVGEAFGIFAVLVGFYWFYSALYAYRHYLEKKELAEERNRYKSIFYQG